MTDLFMAVARRLEETPLDPLEAIGFEPVCKPRVLARLAGVPEQDLPPMCGTCPQERFLGLPDENLDVLYGGAGGGGKSASLLALCIRTALRYPGIQIFWFRKTFPQLNQSVLRNLARYNYAKAVGGRWNGSRYELAFPGASILTFAHAKNMEEAAALSSAEINLLIIDERTTMPPDVVDFLYTRIRSGVENVPCLGVRSACVDEGEVLTDNGWKPIQDVAVGDLVQSVSPSGELSLKRVEATFAGGASDGLVRVDKKTLYMSMTPNHRVVHRNPRSPAHRISSWESLDLRSVNIVRAARSYSAGAAFDVPFGWSPEDYLAFLGLFLAEGCTNSTVRKHHHKTVITQCTRENQAAIKELLNRLTIAPKGNIRQLPSGNFNVRWYEEGVRLQRTFPTREQATSHIESMRLPVKWNLSANGDFQISRKEVWDHFRQFGKAHEKFVPREILNNATAEQLRILFDWMVFGDGTVRDRSVQYFTASQRLADDVAEIALKLCYKVQMRKQELPSAAHRDRYFVYCSQEGDSTLVERHRFGGREVQEHVPFDGTVYCIRVQDNENFFLRQRGKVWLSGNSNPGHVGHGVVKADYVDATDYGTKEVVDKAGRRRIFIPAKATDNPYVGDYDKTLEGISDPDLRARIKDGDWSAMPDAAFPDWKRDRIVVPPFEIPETWQRYGGMDYGWAAPAVYLAAAKDADGRLWFYRELTMIQTPEADQARQILAANAGQHVVSIAADPAMWGKTGSSLPPAEKMATEGLWLTKADNDRLGGKARMHTYLTEAPACAYHRDRGWTTCPMLHVIDGACPQFTKTMGELPRDPNKPEDVDTDAPDHWYDSARYLCMSIGGQAKFHFPGEEKAPDGIDPQAQPASSNLAPPPPAPTMYGGFPVATGFNTW